MSAKSTSTDHGHNVPLGRRLAAVMFTDMAGYTALMQRDEAAALRSREAHRSALERSVPTHGGEILQYFGDGSLSIFGSSVQAVEAAVEIQRILGGDPPLRIGLHVGDIAYDEQGAFGDAINIAARLEALSVPGGILISQNVFDDIRRLPPLRAIPSGSVRLKNVQDAVRTYSVAVEGVAVPPDPVGATDEEVGSATLPPQVRLRLDERTRLPTFSRSSLSVLGRVPLIGREREVNALRSLLDQAGERQGGTAFFRGPRGVGKTRLGQEAAEYSKGRGWTVLSGRAFPAESLVPFALFADAFQPILQGLDRGVLAELVPGGEDALFALFPVLGGAGRLHEMDGQPGELQSRLHWHFAGLVSRLAEYRPLLLILEDLDFADRSSLDLFHFLARQCSGKPIFLIGEYTGSDEKRNRELLSITQSLISQRTGFVFELEPLDLAETREFIRQAFDLPDVDVDDLASLVHHWTGGNPFFVTGTLRGLVEGGTLTKHGATWTRLDLEGLEVPRSMRDAALVWVGHVSEFALRLAQLVAVVGTQVTYEVLAALAKAERDDVSAALDELVRHQILVDLEHRFALAFDFRHPLIRETLRAEMSLADRRRLHGRVAEGLETYYEEQADLHADELAYHFGHASLGDAGSRAIHYLAIAGRNALARYANREAESYLQEALDRIEASGPAERVTVRGATTSRADVMAGLAKARRRLGATRESVALWRKVVALTQAAGDTRSVAKALREMGLTFMAGARFEEAVEAFEQALGLARTTDAAPLVIRILLAQGYCYEMIGRRGEAESAVRDALGIAEELNHPELVGRVHSALLRLHIWTGQLDEVRMHAQKALSLAAVSGDQTVEFWSQWAMGAMEGLIGRTDEMASRIERARELADSIGSPLLRLELAELEIELAYALGEWSKGLAVGEPAIELARSLDARTILPRLLVWVSFIHLGRGDLETADAFTREAWEVSGADQVTADGRYIDVHAVVPAHIGRAAYHVTCHEWGEAVRIAEAGLAIADRTGYVVWAIHHIIPLLGEASIHARKLGRAREVAARMRREAEAVGHPLGNAWAEAGEAALTWLEGGAEKGAIGLRRGAEAMESIPLVYEAAKLRRQLAGRLAEIGDREGAIAELRHVHDVFERLGARPELEKTLVQFREVGAEPPEQNAKALPIKTPRP